MKLIYVIAGSFEEYRVYVRDNNIDGVLYKYITHPDSLRGLSDISGVFIGTWYKNINIANILEQIYIIKTKNGPWSMPQAVDDAIREHGVLTLPHK